MKRRIWRLFDDKSKLDIEDAIIEMALSFRIPYYTGAVKTTYAHKLIHHWNPDAIDVFVFGQIIDESIIKLPKYGIYNIHPADLAHNFGAGFQPFQDLINRDANTSRFTIHQLTTQLDSGGVVGQSPIINVRNEDDSITHNILILEDKMIEPMYTMAVILTKELIKLKKKDSKTNIKNIDFSKYFTDYQKRSLQKPIQEAEPIKELPSVSRFALNLMGSSKTD
jgi:methionyl-tRNA formyltransferase